MPASLLHTVFMLLPLDSRLRAACVCFDWSVFAAAQRELWTRLSFDGCVALTNQLFLAAARRAGNAAVVLELPTGVPQHAVHISRLVLLGVMRANSASLREVRLGDKVYTDATLTEFINTVPHARVFSANVTGGCDDRALPMLRNEPPYAALQLRNQRLCFEYDHDVPPLMAAAAAHSSLRKLHILSDFGMPVALNAVVDAAVSLGLRELSIDVCSFLSAATAALPRLLQSEALTTLTIRKCDYFRPPGTSHLPAGSVPPFGAALSDNSTLTALTIENVHLWEDGHDTDALFAALQSHSSLRSLSFKRNRVPAAMSVAIGSKLGALIAANASALKSLDLYDCNLGDAGMGPVVAALPRNTHLRSLELDNNNMTEPFARAHLLPALQACTTVHTIVDHPWCIIDKCLRTREPGLGQEFEQLLRPRRPAEAAR